MSLGGLDALSRSRRFAAEPAPHAPGEETDVGGLVVEAGDVVEELAARVQELFFAFACDLLECLETVGDKGGREDEEAFLSLLGEALEFVVGVRRQPRFTREA